jgi:hypothetical protein
VLIASLTYLGLVLIVPVRNEPMLREA